MSLEKQIEMFIYQIKHALNSIEDNLLTKPNASLN